ncbi:MAG: L-aspartate semialdehyde sulfurtransferase ferredoxin [Actinomycetota bacterium]|jgi:ABC-type methionine transport system ATPase subunit|nr:L-aspartate semialdehyde sulfurtransferase ferredoxin [Actinomycetota bacterium]MEA2503654.1 L-aspartate semialdehyde sulfurtransferase ferredoxin [Actinomycetota bacterium]MEA2590436.1 L-aspartate semialdehyde sulfurtransferase ferredoxin [Actinomycetota bacterium]
MPKRRVLLTFPENLITEPVIHAMGTRYEIVTNVRRANVEERMGWVILEIDGPEEALDAAVAYAAGLGVEVNEMSGDVVEG